MQPAQPVCLSPRHGADAEARHEQVAASQRLSSWHDVPSRPLLAVTPNVVIRSGADDSHRSRDGGTLSFFSAVKQCGLPA
jgi:hypothetical protein